MTSHQARANGAEKRRRHVLTTLWFAPGSAVTVQKLRQEKAELAYNAASAGHIRGDLSGLQEQGFVRLRDDLACDSHVGACIRRHRGAVAAMHWGVHGSRSPARVTKAVTAMIEVLDMERIIGDAQEATLFGYAPMEIDWRAISSSSPCSALHRWRVMRPARCPAPYVRARRA